jgi:anaerobic magnesium-protoporphyrin IX monomethyl ester cyclase
MMETNPVFLFLNLPHSLKITRRYMCSYESPTSLFPPLELLSLAGVFSEVFGFHPLFMDAIAQKEHIDGVAAFCEKKKVSHLVCLLGFECFDDDIEAIALLKKAQPHLIIIAFGHYATQFSEKILANSSIDIIIKGEPENAFAQILVDWKIENILPTYNGKKSIVVSDYSSHHRIKDYNALPLPAFQLLDHKYYHEPFMPRPFGMIQSARGCPYSCNYCVRSFGLKLTLQSVDTIMAQLRLLKQVHGIRSFRFIDDTFTINKIRTIAICKQIIEEKLLLKWTCLSRTDAVDEETLQWMKRAGCQRIYYGIESGSQRILDFYNKGLSADEALKSVQLTNRSGIESAGFFMLGLPEENEEDFKLNKEFVKAANFHFIAVGGLILYPGTPLFDLYRNEIEFSLFPYVNRFKDKALQERYKRWNKELYHTFLFSSAFATKFLNRFVSSPLITLQTIKDAIVSHRSNNGNIFHHIPRHKESLNYA